MVSHPALPKLAHLTVVVTVSFEAEENAAYDTVRRIRAAAQCTPSKVGLVFNF